MPQQQHYKFTVLINNVGFGHKPAKDFSPFTSQSRDEILDVNIRFTTHLTHFFSPILGANSTPTKPCLILIAGSLAQIGLPWVPVYSATKSYITTFSRALDTELKGEGVNLDVVASVIGDTDTPGHRVGTSLFTPSSAMMAKSILDDAGRGDVVDVPYLAHILQHLLCDIQPFWLLQKGLIANLKAVVRKSR
jgi:17beta-estradiol 17-dehydrogenase / very-long-chain 3-oxoacyl-CoA reductase